MIPVLPLYLEFTAAADLRLPRYPGSTWRGAFGQRLRQLSCITGAPTCEGCPVLRRCTYGQLFETPPPEQGEAFHSQYDEVPHPYILSPRHTGGQYPAGTALPMELILLPQAAQSLAYLLVTLQQMRLRSASLTLQSIAPLPPAGDGAPVAGDGLAALLELAPRAPEPGDAPARVRLTFEHPLRLRSRNRYLGPADFDFGIFFTTLMRRISMLRSALGQPLTVDFRALAESAREVAIESAHLRWIDWSRYSGRQKKQIPMGGLIGPITITGDLEPLWPWLWLGQWLHAGKGAVMGLGRYRIEAEP